MFSRGVLLGCVFALCCLRAESLPVHVTFEWPAGKPASTMARVRVQAVRSAGHTGSAAPVEAEGSSVGATLNLADGIWQIQPSVPGYWSPGAEIAVPGQVPDGVHVALWPAASLHGELVTAGGEPLPQNLEVQLSAAQGLSHQPTAMAGNTQIARPSHATMRCRITTGMWNCLGPAGLFDVRLQTAQYTPRYLWGVSLKATETTDLGRTVLRQAPSVFGRAVRQDGSDPPAPCQAILLPDLERRGGPDPEANEPRSNKTFSVPLTPRGYFQIVGVLPGRHMLAVECQAASGLRELRIQEDGETRIDPALRLEELTLDVTITPKVDPAGQPWKLAVTATAPHFRRIANGDTASADGRWARRGLMAGDYHVVVTGSNGAVWLQRDFKLRANGGPLALRVGSVRIAGRALLSSQPVRARLVFSNNASGESATLDTDESGRFHGLLPVAQTPQESTWTVQARIAQPPVTQRLLDIKVPPGVGGAEAWLDLDFPAVPVRGSVVSTDGKPQPNVQVTFEDSAGVRTTTGTDDAGRFEMSDLPAGKYTAVADSPAGASDRTPFEVADGGGNELKLVLNPYKRLAFYVVSSNGPVEDATVQVWIAPGVPRAFVRTDSEGKFEVSLPPGITELGLTIGAPGYALKLVRLQIPSEENDSRDARTITLDTSAGTLVLNFQLPSRDREDTATLYLVHNRAIQDARTIVGWGANRGGATANEPATIDSIEPGDYALCRVDPTNVALLWSGPLPANRCSKGSLDESRTLTLAAP